MQTIVALLDMPVAAIRISSGGTLISPSHSALSAISGGFSERRAGRDLGTSPKSQARDLNPGNGRLTSHINRAAGFMGIASASEERVDSVAPVTEWPC